MSSPFISYDQPQMLPRPARYHIVRRLAEDKTTPLCCFEIAYRTHDELRALGVVPVPMTPTRPGTGRTVAYGVVSPTQGQSYGMSIPRSGKAEADRTVDSASARFVRCQRRGTSPDVFLVGSLPIGLITPRSSY